MTHQQSSSEAKDHWAE